MTKESGMKRTMARERRFFVVCFTLVVLFVVLCTGCGRKSPPFIPEQKPFVLRVETLEGAFLEKGLRLGGQVQGDDESLSRIAGCRVYYVWYPMDAPPCEGCPIEMKNYRDIMDRIIDHGRFSCFLPGFKQKGICYVTVRLMEKGERLGPKSNRIKLISGE